MKPYQPKQGDIVWINFDPQVGIETKGRRPALVVWNNEALKKMPMRALVCIITNTDNGFPLHVKINTKNTTGFVMCEQIKMVDLEKRNCEYKDHIDSKKLEEVINILKIML